MTGEASPLRVAVDVSAVPARPAGAGRYIVELVRALGERSELSLSLVTRRADAERWREISPRGRLLPLVPSARPLRLAYERAVLGRRLSRSREGLDCYHGPHYTMPGGLTTGRVVTIHDLTFIEHPEWHEAGKVPFFRAAIKRAAAKADVVVCVSELTAERLAGLVELRAKVVVAEHGVDHERFKPGPPELGALPAGLSVSPGTEDAKAPRFVLFVGTLEPRKGAVELVSAFSRLASYEEDLVLVLVGRKEWGYSEISAAVDASEFKKRILLLGYVSDEELVNLMRAAAVVCYPSYEEGFGLPVVEAMATGAVVVTTEGTAMAGFARGAGFLAPLGSTEGLAATLGAALGAGERELEARRRTGIALASRFSWQAAAERHMEAYELAAGAFAARS